MESNQTVQILLVEDDQIDVDAVKRAFRKQRISNPIVVAEDGIAALQTLRGDGEVGALARPYLVLLDLNMPRMNGIEFLQNLRQDPLLHDSVVFVLTTSDTARDKVAAYEQHIAGYLVKSKVGEDFINLVNMVHHYMRCVELPPRRDTLIVPIATSA